MAWLSPAALTDLPRAIARPQHDVRAIRTGIVHFGPGAFHRAHQAAYVDRLLDQDPRWGIAAVSLRSADTVAAMQRQQGLYTLAIRDREPSLRVLAAHSEALGPGGEARLQALLSNPAVRLVTSTVTEKGYCLSADGTLDFDHPDIVHDLGKPRHPRSLVGWLVAGLADRLAAGLPPFAMLSCDNMTTNGDKLRAATVALAEARDRELARWIAAEAAFPNSMVDAITPASDAALLDEVEAALGARDEIAVQREGFSQWVLERFSCEEGPDLASAGVTFTSDVAGYERAKLRILNGSHSSLAYLGLLLGHASVGEAMADAALGGFVERLSRQDFAGSVGRVDGLDVADYAETILSRFRNPRIRHLLSQIAWDGSQKLPYRLLEPIAEALGAGRSIARLVVPTAAWIAFVRRSETLVDPLADSLMAAVRASDDPAEIVRSVLHVRAVFPQRLGEDQTLIPALTSALASILRGETRALLAR